MDNWDIVWLNKGHRQMYFAEKNHLEKLGIFNWPHPLLFRFIVVAWDVNLGVWAGLPRKYLLFFVSTVEFEGGEQKDLWSNCSLYVCMCWVAPQVA